MFQRSLGFTALAAAMMTASPAAEAVIYDGTDGATGRFIQITKTSPTNAGDANRFHIGEVEAFAEGVTPLGGLDNANDLALSSKGAVGSTVSGTAQHGSNAALVSGTVSTGGGTWSRQNPLPIIAQVDLGSTNELGEIRVWQRGDGCCQQRQEDFTVTVLADNGGTPGDVVYEQSFIGQTPTNSFTSFSTLNKIIDPGAVGVVGMDVVTGGLDARYIQVTKTAVVNPGDANRLHIGEIEAFAFGATPAAGLDNANDLALSSMGAVGSTVSGTPQHGADSALVNGAVDTGATTWSRQNPLPITAQVDLGQTRNLDSVRVWQRGDGCCQGRLEDFSVTVFADDGSGGIGDVLATIAVPGQVPTNSFADIQLPDGFYIGDRDIPNIDIDVATLSNDLLKVGAAGDGLLFIAEGATLNINLIGAAGEIANTDLQIIDASGIFGVFSNITFANTSIGSVNTDLLSDGIISIRAIPEPTTALLGLAGVAGLMIRRRRVA